MLDIVWLLLLVLAGAALMTAGYAYRLAQLEVQRHLPCNSRNRSPVGTVGLVGVIYGVALLMRYWPALK